MQRRLVTRYATRSREPNPITGTAAFARFQEGHPDRRDGGVDQQSAELVGAYLTTIR